LSLDKDLELTDQSMSYDGSSRRSTVQVPANMPRPTGPAAIIATRRSANSPPQTHASGAPAPESAWPLRGDGSPDFASMTSAQRSAYDLWRLRRKYG
jgi:hypothetical protein